jgi:hypothetical protein
MEFLEFDFCEAKIISVQAWHNDLFAANLLAISGHKFIPLVEVPQSRITSQPAVWRNALIT